jgi:hypothetical protein
MTPAWLIWLRTQSGPIAQKWDAQTYEAHSGAKNILTRHALEPREAQLPLKALEARYPAPPERCNKTLDMFETTSERACRVTP